MQRMHYQENAWNEHSLFAFLQEMNLHQQVCEFWMNCMACGKLHRRMPVKIPKAKSIPYISLNVDLAKLEIKQNIVPFSLIFKAKP